MAFGFLRRRANNIIGTRTLKLPTYMKVPESGQESLKFRGIDRAKATDIVNSDAGRKFVKGIATHEETERLKSELRRRGVSNPEKVLQVISRRYGIKKEVTTEMRRLPEYIQVPQSGQASGFFRGITDRAKATDIVNSHEAHKVVRGIATRQDVERLVTNLRYAGATNPEKVLQFLREKGIR